MAARFGCALHAQALHGAFLRHFGLTKAGAVAAAAVQIELRDRGPRIGRKRVARLMRAARSRAREPHPFRHTTDSGHGMAIKDNPLALQFAVLAPAGHDRIPQKWSGFYRLSFYSSPLFPPPRCRPVLHLGRSLRSLLLWLQSGPFRGANVHCAEFPPWRRVSGALTRRQHFSTLCHDFQFLPMVFFPIAFASSRSIFCAAGSIP
jgi:hypothetical protein